MVVPFVFQPELVEEEGAEEELRLLTEEEKIELKECKVKIDRAVKGFKEIGPTLTNIRVKKLYLETHRSMDAYARERFGFGKQQVSHYILAAQDHATLALIYPVEQLPTSERAMRELRGVPEEEVKEVLALAADNGPPTTNTIKEARKRKENPAEKQPAKIKTDSAIKSASRLATFLEICDVGSLSGEQRETLVELHARIQEHFVKFTLVA